MGSLESAISNLDSAWLIAALSTIAIVAIVLAVFVRSKLQHRARLAERALRESERQHLMLDSLPAAVVVLDGAGKVHRYNDAWLKLVREPAFRMMDGGQGQHYRQVLRRLAAIPESTPETTLEAGIRRVSRSRDQRFDEELLTARQGNWPWFHVYVRTMDDGEEPGIVLMLVNISARKRHEINFDSSIDDLLQEEMSARDTPPAAGENKLQRTAQNGILRISQWFLRYNPTLFKAAFGACGFTRHCRELSRTA